MPAQFSVYAVSGSGEGLGILRAESGRYLRKWKHSSTLVILVKASKGSESLNLQLNSLQRPKPALDVEINQHKHSRHLILIEDNEGQRIIPLEASSHSLGRAPTNSIVLRSKLVSRQHALLLRVTSEDPNHHSFLLIDGNLQGHRSTNGLLVNGEKQTSCHLKHGDQIFFGKQIKAKYLRSEPLTDSEFQDYCQALDFDAVLVATENFRDTASRQEIAEPHIDTASLVRLASFPEIIPSPILEVNLAGELTYLNPAAVNIFPELQSMGIKHPALTGLLDLIQESDHHILVREVTVAHQVFEQSIHYISESDLIRCCVFDITERKHAEAELRKRDRLLQSVAEATTHLLETVGYDQAITKALDTLGRAAGVDRICIWHNHRHPETDAIATSISIEWTRDSIASVQHQPHRQNQLYTAPHLKQWYHHLTDETTICGLTQDFPEAERAFLAQDRIISVLVVPIIVNQRFWGFIELDNCSFEYHWSQQEESVLGAMAASISAALQRQEKEDIIRHQAYHDALTDLPNRVLFQDRLQLALAAAHRNQGRVAVMFFDLDRFKTINDTLGHTIGDQLLKEVTKRLKQCLRQGDTLARWGGDEFTVLLPQIESVHNATHAAYRILGALKTSFSISGHELFMTASIGISVFPEDGQEPESLLKNADIALYRSKEQGRGNCQLYNATMNSQTPELLALENSLRHALDRDEFLLYYQPKVNVRTGEIVGLEALVRWEHPEMGLVSPGTFIPLAEETGLIIDIGAWVLRTACQQVVAWHRLGFQPLSIAVNLSPCQFYQPKLPDVITQILGLTQLPPHLLELEITETTVVENMDYTQTLLRQLQDIGVHIAMDDFGTGYSSLNYLKNLPFNTLKIDQSFIRDLKPASKDAEIINAVIGLGRGLDLCVVAEGVENPEQLDLLRSLQCDIVQGYLFSRPLTVDNTTAILQANWLQRSQRVATTNGHLPQAIIR